MADPDDSRYTLSYDFVLRGEEILSGSQRIHRPSMLLESLEFYKAECQKQGIEINLEALLENPCFKCYYDSFKYGAHMHGGAGLGIERIVKLYLNLDNIRSSSMFPRDPKRLFP